MYTFDSRIRYSEMDSEGKLTMASLINYFQDCSTFQSEELGVGLEYLRGKGVAWVLNSWQIVVERYPGLGEKVTVGTLPYELKGFMGHRNFAMLDEQGRFLAKANSMWTLLDIHTGYPVAIPQEIFDKYEITEKLDMEYAPRKIAVPKTMEKQEGVVVTRHHLDTNHHVNNQQFVSITMDYLPADFEIRQVRAEYRKQAFLGDVLVPYVAKTGDKITVILMDQDQKTYMAAEFS